MRRVAAKTSAMKTMDMANRNSAYGHITKASTTLATITPVKIGTRAHTMVSQNISNAPSNLFVCDTRDPLKRFAWKATLWSVRWSKTCWNSSAMPLTSIVHVAQSTIRQAMTVPTIWLIR